MNDIKAGDWVQFVHKGKSYVAIAESLVFVGTMMVRMKPSGLGTPSLIPIRDCSLFVPDLNTKEQ